MEKWTFYIDECGNTGSNWLDSRQTFFIYGGWLINDAQYNACSNELKSLLTGQQIKELKAVKFFRYDKQCKKYANIFWKLIKEYHAIPSFVIVEKRFMIAAKIVETFYDPEYNPNLDSRASYPLQWKKELAQKITEYDNVIEAFADVISNKNNTVEQMKRVCDVLRNNLNSDDAEEFASCLENLQSSNFLEMVDELDVSSDGSANKRWNSLMLPMLNELLKNVELYARVQDYEISVVHDELSHYDDIFKLISEIHFQQDKGEPEIYDGRVSLVGYPHIKDIKQKRSHADILIQMADLLCGFVHSTIAYQYEEVPNKSEDILKIWEYLIYLHDAIGKNNIYIWDSYDSSIIMQRLHELYN